MKHLLFSLSIIISAFIAVAVVYVSGQTPTRKSSYNGFNGIIPLESNCADVKRLLAVDRCTLPQSVYLLERFWVTVKYLQTAKDANRVCYNVPAGTVLSVDVSYNKPAKIKDFEYKLKFSKEPVSDIPTKIYNNIDKGITVISHDGFANSATFEPTAQAKRKHSIAGCKAKLSINTSN